MVERLRLHAREEVEPEQREERDQQSQRGRDQRLRDARRHLRRRDQSRAADHLEGLHHAGDRSEQTHQWRRGNHRLEHPQAAAEALFDVACFVAGARFDPPRGLVAIVANHCEEPPVNVHRRERRQLPVQLIPGKAVGLDQIGQRARQPQASVVHHRAVENDEHGNDPEEQAADIPSRRRIAAR